MFSNKSKFALLLTAALLFLAGPGAAQAPAPIATSGQFHTRPLVPAQGEDTRLHLAGQFAFSNATILVASHQVAPELISVELTSAWTGGTQQATDSDTTDWTLAIDLGDLPQDFYDIVVRVNGDNAFFIFDYFYVEAPRPEPAPLPTAAPNVVPQRALGTNLAFLKDWAQALTFVDAFKASRPWFSLSAGGEDWFTGEPIDTDAYGWVRSLAPGQEAGTLMLTGLGSAYPGGRYTVLYEGEGELFFDWDARIIDAEPGRMELYVAPESGIHMRISSVNPDNYIRNIRVLMPGHEDTYLEQPFHPTYVDFLSQFSTLRFMDWMEATSTEIAPGEWANRITPAHATQASGHGVAAEHIIEMANTVGRDAWINIPHTANDDYVDSLATMLLANLNPDLLIHIECSNEVWNPDYIQHQYAIDRGLDLSDDPFTAALRYQSQRAVEIFAIFERVFGSTDRLVRVLNGWIPDTLALSQDVAHEILGWQNAAQHADAYAVAPYFGWAMAQPDQEATIAALSVEEVLELARTDMRHMVDIGRDLSALVASYNVDFVTYEAGMGMVRAGATPFEISPAEQRLIEANEHPIMEEIYAELLDGWHQYGGLMNMFTDIQYFRRWGMLTRWDQDINTAPKYRAIQAFLQSTPDPDAGPPILPPQPSADSGQFHTRPLVPAQGEDTRLVLSGTFPFSNAAIALDQFTVAPELITLDLNTTWLGDTQGPLDATETPWTVEVELGDLAADVYDLLVRVDNEQFLFHYFVVEAPRPEPQPLPVASPPVTPQRSLGINLAGTKDHSDMLIFVDAFKVTREWISHRWEDGAWDSGEPVDTDAYGWVRSLAPGQEAGTLLLTDLSGAYPGGRYTVLYEGEGELFFDWDARIIDAEPGRMELYVTPDIGIHLSIRAVNPDNYIRNIRVIMPGHEDTYLEQPFHPTYVDFLGQFNTLRFSDWVEINSPENNTPEAGQWGNRITPTHASQGTIRGASLEYAIDMANAVGRDPWFSVPATATDEYVVQMATLIRDRLNPALQAYIEYSNETFNYAFPQHNYVVQRGTELGLSADHFVAGMRYHAQRSVEVFTLFGQVFGSNDRLTRVLGGWQVDDLAEAEFIAGEILGWQNAAQHADAYAVAPYFGWHLAQPEYADSVATSSVTQLLDDLTVEMRAGLDIGRRIGEIATAHGVELFAYEAGHHLVSVHGDPYPNDTVRDRLYAVHYDERMYDIYAEYLDGWHEFSSHMNLFTDIQDLGNFGLLSRWDQAVEASPKFMAVRDFLQSAPAAATPKALSGETEAGQAPLADDIGFGHFFLFADAFGGSDPAFDFNGDGTVDFGDFFILLEAMGAEERAKLIGLAQTHLGLPESSSLEPNYPNPFNSSTVIPYRLAQGGPVQLDIYDMTGQKIRSMARRHDYGGSYEFAWNGRDASGRDVGSGMYLARLQAGSQSFAVKMTLIK